MFAASKHPLPENLEPSSVREAMKHKNWREAISSELDALIGNGTWTLVPPTNDQNVVGCKWLFRIKRNSDGGGLAKVVMLNIFYGLHPPEDPRILIFNEY